MPLNYRPEDQNNIRLREDVIGHFRLNRGNLPEEEIPTQIDTVIDPIFKRRREYVNLKCGARNKGMEPAP